MHPHHPAGHDWLSAWRTMQAAATPKHADITMMTDAELDEAIQIIPPMEAVSVPVPTRPTVEPRPTCRIAEGEAEALIGSEYWCG